VKGPLFGWCKSRPTETSRPKKNGKNEKTKKNTHTFEHFLGKHKTNKDSPSRRVDMSVNPINSQTLLQADNQSVGDEGGPLQIIRNIHKVIVELTSKIASGECKKKERKKHTITFDSR
jgi:hypothetical protein